MAATNAPPAVDDPFAGIDKGKVLQEKRLFNEAPIKVRGRERSCFANVG